MWVALTVTVDERLVPETIPRRVLPRHVDFKQGRSHVVSLGVGRVGREPPRTDAKLLGLQNLVVGAILGEVELREQGENLLGKRTVVGGEGFRHGIGMSPTHPTHGGFVFWIPL